MSKRQNPFIYKRHRKTLTFTHEDGFRFDVNFINPNDEEQEKIRKIVLENQDDDLGIAGRVMLTKILPIISDFDLYDAYEEDVIDEICETPSDFTKSVIIECTKTVRKISNLYSEYVDLIKNTNTEDLAEAMKVKEKSQIDQEIEKARKVLEILEKQKEGE